MDLRQRPEQLVIRPPSEWQSALLRVTRGCAWNRCRFCGLYPALGQPSFARRSRAEIAADISLLAGRLPSVRCVFLGDADPLDNPLPFCTDVLRSVRAAWPALQRVTAYARATTLWKHRLAGLQQLAQAGLTRVHVGLESGDRQTLRFHKKGVTPEVLIETGGWLREAGIETSLYVLLGLGGRRRWREHIDGTARMLAAVEPCFVRVRRLWLYQQAGQGPRCPLLEDIEAGRFEPQTPEGTVLELRRLVEGLERVNTSLLCDHANNYVQVQGRLPGEREQMLREIDAFLALPEELRERHYLAVGSQI